MRLSDAFEETGSLGIIEKGSAALELTVKVININQGRNEGIARKCKTLAEYSAFVDKVRVNEKETGNIEVIHDITGLDGETIRKLQEAVNKGAN